MSIGNSSCEFCPRATNINATADFIISARLIRHSLDDLIDLALKEVNDSQNLTTEYACSEQTNTIVDLVAMAAESINGFDSTVIDQMSQILGQEFCVYQDGQASGSDCPKFEDLRPLVIQLQ